MDQPLITAFLKGLALSAGLIVAIGAQNLFVLRQGLKGEHVAPIVLLCATSDAVLISAGVNGLGGLLALVPGLSLALSLGGAAFLGWYGVSALRRASRASTMIAGGGAAMPLGAALAGAAAFTFLNPHVYIDTVLLTGAVGAALPAPERPLFIAGAVTSSVVWFSSLGFGARLVAPLFARPAAWRALDVAVGLMMLGLAGSLLWGVATP